MALLGKAYYVTQQESDFTILVRLPGFSAYAPTKGTLRIKKYGNNNKSVFPLIQK